MIELDFTAWKEGFKAGFARLDSSVCPHLPGKLAHSWHSGYIEGKSETKSRRARKSPAEVSEARRKVAFDRWLKLDTNARHEATAIARAAPAWTPATGE